jgi:transposase
LRHNRPRTGIIDSTGLETHHSSQHYVYRVKKRFKRKLYACWPKLSILCDQETHLIASAVVTLGSSPDYPQFKTLLKEANRLIRFNRIIADAGYDSEENHRFARETLHIPDTVIKLAARGKRRVSGRRSSKPIGWYRAQMKSHFKVRVYAQRSQVESVFSRNKRRLESFLRAKGWSAQKRECLLHVLTHNLMILGAVEK